MKKSVRSYIIAWAILLILFNVIIFATPNEAAGMNKFGGGFWPGYAFIMLAFIGQLLCALFAFNADNAEKLFLRLPLIRISYTALVLTLIVGTLCMVIPNLPYWVGIIACLAILAFSAIAIVKAQAAAELVNAREKQVKTETSFIRSLTVDAERLINLAKSEESKAAAKKVFEAVRYSDPISNEALTEIEMQISKRFSEFATAVCTENSENISILVGLLISLIETRNRTCKRIK